jgi:hypothetical protein
MRVVIAQGDAGMTRRIGVIRGVSDLRAGQCRDLLVLPGRASKASHRLDRCYLRADQAVKTPTKPAEVWNATAGSEINTLGSFRLMA